MLSSTGNDVEPGANGLGVSRGDALSENGSVSLPIVHDEDPLDLERSSSTRSSSANAHRCGRSGSHDQDDPLSPSAVHGSTPLSQIGAHSSVNDIYLGQGRLVNPANKSDKQIYFLYLSVAIPKSFFP